METRILPYFGNPTERQKAALRDAKAAIDPGFLILPKPVDADTVGIALAFEWPNYCYLFGFADVRTVDTPERMEAALRAIWYGDGADRLTTPEKWLTRALKAAEGGVREIEVEDV